MMANVNIHGCRSAKVLPELQVYRYPANQNYAGIERIALLRAIVSWWRRI